jgi:hypothetical protein
LQRWGVFNSTYLLQLSATNAAQGFNKLSPND